MQLAGAASLVCSVVAAVRWRTAVTILNAAAVCAAVAWLVLVHVPLYDTVRPVLLSVALPLRQARRVLKHVGACSCQVCQERRTRSGSMCCGSSAPTT